METILVPGLLAGFFGLIGLLITKENKVSEFRQAWVDALRQDIAKFLALAEHNMSVVYSESWSMKDEVDPKEFQKQIVDRLAPDLGEMCRLLNVILLRLNPKDDRELIAVLEKVNEHFNGGDPEDLAGFAQERTEAIRKSQDLLKQNWTQVKRGEFLYRWSRRVIVAVVVLMLFLATLNNF